MTFDNTTSLNQHQEEFLQRVNAAFIRSFQLINKHAIPKEKLMTVYGSARMTPDNPVYQEIVTFCSALREQGFFTMVTGGGPGVMEAAFVNDTRDTTNTRAFGININREVSNAKYEEGITYDDFFVRKYFLRESKFIIACPGGFGTLDEIMELLTLVQTEKLHDRTVILYSEPFWQPLIEWFKNILLVDGYISASDLALFRVVATPQEVIDIVLSS